MHQSQSISSEGVGRENDAYRCQKQVRRAQSSRFTKNIAALIPFIRQSSQNPSAPQTFELSSQHTEKISWVSNHC